MVSTRLQQLVRGMFWLAGVTLLAGCSSIGGSVANSSGMGYYERGNYAAAADEFQHGVSAKFDVPHLRHVAILDAIDVDWL